MGKAGDGAGSPPDEAQFLQVAQVEAEGRILTYAPRWGEPAAGGMRMMRIGNGTATIDVPLRFKAGRWIGTGPLDFPNGEDGDKAQASFALDAAGTLVPGSFSMVARDDYGLSLRPGRPLYLQAAVFPLIGTLASLCVAPADVARPDGRRRRKFLIHILSRSYRTYVSTADLDAEGRYRFALDIGGTGYPRRQRTATGWFRLGEGTEATQVHADVTLSEEEDWHGLRTNEFEAPAAAPRRAAAAPGARAASTPEAMAWGIVGRVASPADVPNARRAVGKLLHPDVVGHQRHLDALGEINAALDLAERQRA